MKRLVVALILIAIMLSTAGNVLAAPAPTPTVAVPGDDEDLGDVWRDAESQLPPVPEGKDPPTGLPVEIEVPEDGSDADIVLKMKIMKALEQKAVWAITVNNKKYKGPNMFIPDGFIETYTLILPVTGQNGGARIGEYTGSGYLTWDRDPSGYAAMLEEAGASVALLKVSTLEGPLTDVRFTLSETCTSKEFYTAIQAEKSPGALFANGEMTWNVSGVQSEGIIDGYYHESSAGAREVRLRFNIAVGPKNGGTILQLCQDGLAIQTKYSPSFIGRCSKKISWVSLSQCACDNCTCDNCVCSGDNCACDNCKKSQ